MADFGMLGEAFVEIRAKFEKFDKDTLKLKERIDGALKGIATGGAIAAAAAVAGIGAAAVKTGIELVNMASDFQEATNALIVGTGASGDALADMEQIVKNLKGQPAGLGKEFGELGAVVAEVNTRTGATGDSLQAMSEQILNISRLTGGDAVKNVQLITRAMGDWGVPIEDSAKLMDSLFGASQAFGIGVDQLASKVVQFGAPLRNMGFGLEESIALFGKWEKEGVNTELVLGSLRIAAGKFAKDAGEMTLGPLSDELQSFVDITENDFPGAIDEFYAMVAAGKSLDEIKMNWSDEAFPALDQLYERTQTAGEGTKTLRDNLEDSIKSIQNASSEQEALAMAMEVFGARAGPDMAAAIREGRFELDAAIESLAGTSGGLEDATNRALSLQDRFTLLKEGAMVSLMPIGQAVLDIAEKALPKMQQIMQDAQPVIEEFAANFAENLEPALAAVVANLRGIADVMGITNDEMTDGEAIAKLLGTSLEGVITVMEKLTGFAESAVGFWDRWGNALKAVLNPLGTLRNNVEKLDQDLQDLTSALPDWMTPGSPTPLQLGIEGINKAINSIPDLSSKFEMTPSFSGLSSGGGNSIDRSTSIGIGDINLTTGNDNIVDGAVREFAKVLRSKLNGATA